MHIFRDTKKNEILFSGESIRLLKYFTHNLPQYPLITHSLPDTRTETAKWHDSMQMDYLHVESRSRNQTMFSIP